MISLVVFWWTCTLWLNYKTLSKYIKPLHVTWPTSCHRKLVRISWIIRNPMYARIRTQKLNEVLIILRDIVHRTSGTSFSHIDRLKTRSHSRFVLNTGAHNMRAAVHLMRENRVRGLCVCVSLCVSVFAVRLEEEWDGGFSASPPLVPKVRISCAMRSENMLCLCLRTT